MNEWRIAQALRSTRSLEEHIYQLTAEELARALELEQGSARRSAILSRIERDQRRREREQHKQP